MQCANRISFIKAAALRNEAAMYRCCYSCNAMHIHVHVWLWGLTCFIRTLTCSYNVRSKHHLNYFRLTLYDSLLQLTGVDPESGEGGGGVSRALHIKIDGESQRFFPILNISRSNSKMFCRLGAPGSATVAYVNPQLFMDRLYRIYKGALWSSGKVPAS
jgi:hypothetical protein